jgi:hypothetical protein
VEGVRELGVVRLAFRPAGPDEQGKILLYGEGTDGVAEQDWTAFDTWLTEYLHHHQRADARRKLMAGIRSATSFLPYCPDVDCWRAVERTLVPLRRSEPVVER